MPKIQWIDLPPALRDHLFERLRERKITAEDLYELKAWRESEPDAPDGLWYKDFGTFKICGEGQYPKTFLLRGQTATGEELCVHGRGHHFSFVKTRTAAPRFHVTWLLASSNSKKIPGGSIWNLFSAVASR